MTQNIKETTQNNKVTEKRLYKLEKQPKSNAFKDNENEQCSRRNNLRIFELHKSDKKDYLSIVLCFHHRKTPNYVYKESRDGSCSQTRPV